MLLAGGLCMVAVVAGCRRKDGAAAPPPRAVPVTEHAPLDLRLASFNIRNENNRDAGERDWTHRTRHAVVLIRRLDPDVLGMQELTHGQAADLWASLPDYEFIGKAREDGVRKGEYAGIFYRASRLVPGGELGTFWLSGAPEKAGSTGWGNTLPRIATWVRLVERDTGRGFYVFNTHYDHRHQGSRERASILLAERISSRLHKEEPVVLMGDFNAEVTNPAVAYLTGNGGMVAGTSRRWQDALADTYQALHATRRPPKTLHFWGTREGWKIDHILVSKGARILEAAVAPDALPYSSDHFPVTARVVFD